MPHALCLTPNALCLFRISNVFHIYTWTKSHIFIFSHCISYLVFISTLLTSLFSVQNVFHISHFVFLISYLVFSNVFHIPTFPHARGAIFSHCISYFVFISTLLTSLFSVRPPRRIQCSKRLSYSHIRRRRHIGEAAHFHICISYLVFRISNVFDIPTWA